MVGTAADVADITQVDKLLQGEENMVGADTGYSRFLIGGNPNYGRMREIGAYSLRIVKGFRNS